MIDAAENTATQHSKTAIVTGILTMATTVLVSFIAIVPHLRSGDAKRFDQLQQQFEALKQQAVTPTVIPPDPSPRMNIKGTVYRDRERKRKLTGMEVYLLPEGNHLLTAKADDSGQFELQGLPLGTYSIIVRDPLGGMSGRAILSNDGDQVDVIGASVKYQIRQ